MKKLIAYSSVAHMGFVTIGIFAMNVQGVQGGIFQMLSHGIVSGALFLCVGVVYDRMHTREIAAYGGLVNRMPLYALAFMLFTLANVGLPGTTGFIGEFLTLLGAFRVNTWVAFLAATGVILSAAYALCLYRRMIFGALDKESLKAILDLSPREIAHSGAARRAGAVLRLLPGAGHAGQRRLGRPARQQLPRSPVRGRQPRRAGALEERAADADGSDDASGLPARAAGDRARDRRARPAHDRRLRRRRGRRRWSPCLSVGAHRRSPDWSLIFVSDVGTTFNGAFVVDPFARLMKILVLIGSARRDRPVGGLSRAPRNSSASSIRCSSSSPRSA